MSVSTSYKYIVCTPGVLGGKPRITGRRISVQNIAICYEYLGMSPDEICVEYNLTLAEVHMALAYYFDHREEIEKRIKDGEKFVEKLRKRKPYSVTKGQ